MIYKETYIALLKDGVCTVKFDKADGTERKMRCTLNEKLLPEDDRAGAVAVALKPSNDNVVACWDLDKAGWRSFRIDSVIDVGWYSVAAELKLLESNKSDV